MKNMFHTFLLLLLLFAGCGNNDPSGGETPVSPPEIQLLLNPTELSFNGQGSGQAVTLTVNREWKVVSDQAWCSCSPAFGAAGSLALQVNVIPNTSKTARTATLTFSASNITKTCVVKQEGGEETGTSNSVPEGYSLVWQDEFNDAQQGNGKAALPNTTEWWYETGAGGWGNHELQNYIPGVSGNDTCAQIFDGTLKITAKKAGSQVLSVRMNTKQNWTYGYFEARLKLPQGKGTWPAFWMMPQNFKAWPDDGEIDIMEEVGFRPNWVSSSVHCKAYYHSIGTQKTAEKFVATAESDFHIYAVEWTADVIRGFVDGAKYFEFPNDKKGNKDTWPFNTPFYLKLNLAWGGDWGGAQGVDESKLPATYEVDYVRVYQKK
ncbi:beta-glucanase [Bacteroidia bacterium]|nr:beta-glucanase [Bacteroidia bacterium]